MLAAFEGDHTCSRIHLNLEQLVGLRKERGASLQVDQYLQDGRRRVLRQVDDAPARSRRVPPAALVLAAAPLQIGVFADAPQPKRRCRGRLCRYW